MKKSYYELLARKDEKHKCQVLNIDGDLCNKKSLYEVDAHLDSELYNFSCRWISFFVCKYHWNMNKYLWTEKK